MALTEQQLAANKRSRMIEHAKTKQLGTYRGIVARDLQKAIRAEAGAYVGNVKCVCRGMIETVYSPLGEVVCVTCAKVLPWSKKGTDAGHFLAGRSAGILFEEAGIHPQCSACNQYASGAQEAYLLYMQHVYGDEVIDDLRRRKRGFYIDGDGNEVKLQPQTKEQLVDMRIGYMQRVKTAENIIKSGGVKNNPEKVE